MRINAVLMFGLAASTALALGCSGGGDPIEPPQNAAVSGPYKLETVNGRNLPFTTYESQGRTFPVTDGSILLKEDSTYVLVVQVEVGPNDLSNIDDLGTYTVDGSSIHGSAGEGDRFDFDAEFDDGELSLVWQNDTYRLESCPSFSCLLDPGPSQRIIVR